MSLSPPAEFLDHFVTVIMLGVIVFTYPLLPKKFSVLDPAHFLRAPFLVMTVIVCTPLSAGGIEPPTKFSKREGRLDRTLILRGRLLEKRG